MMDFLAHPLSLQTVYLLVSVAIAWSAAIVVYRLYFSPIANVPGPKLAAATGLVEIWYDLVLGGQYVFQIEKWHEQYGPIVRITPWQVHIRDPDFHDELYTMKQPRHRKLDYICHRFNTPSSLSDTPDSDLHDRRRAPVASLFSRQRVQQLLPSVQQKAHRVVDHIQRYCDEEGKVVRLDKAWAAYATDNVLWFTLAMSYNFVDAPGFLCSFTEATSNLIYSIHWLTHFPILMKVFNAIPPKTLTRLSEEIGAIFQFQEDVRGQVRRVVSGENEGHKAVAHRTVFHELSKEIGQAPGAMKEMEDNGVNTTLAGVETTTRSGSLTSFWILKKPEVHARLKAELEAAIPDPMDIPSFTELEKLPYLNAVIQEGLRLTYGVSGRIARWNPSISVRYRDYVLPPRTEFAMTPALQHRNPDIFPGPLEYIPERWLDNPVSPSGHPLSKYMVVFSRGPRMCLGMHLAQAELFIGIATIFRRLDVGLLETERDVVDMAADYFAPVPGNAKGGVRIRRKAGDEELGE
ncbi:Cytochrome P450 [Lecanosticta acicola]|uniref:Cytochrome P450 n=1 Tax=Lecanosticta acicola TaxID=111012 RepID=A0AAI9E7D7_9PEZI|nr:Cytochrome P450 [Lecanosticta acicola]